MSAPPNQVAVTVHGAELARPLAIHVQGAGGTARALGAALAAWPEHEYWLWSAFERGDTWTTRIGPGAGDVWFFEGDEGEALASL